MALSNHVVALQTLKTLLDLFLNQALQAFL